VKQVVLAGGALAIIALLGGLTVLPPQVAFFIGSIPIVLFPGLALAWLLGLARTEIR